MMNQQLPTAKLNAAHWQKHAAKNVRQVNQKFANLEACEYLSSEQKAINRAELQVELDEWVSDELYWKQRATMH